MPGAARTAAFVTTPPTQWNGMRKHAEIARTCVPMSVAFWPRNMKQLDRVFASSSSHPPPCLHLTPAKPGPEHQWGCLVGDAVSRHEHTCYQHLTKNIYRCAELTKPTCLPRHCYADSPSKLSPGPRSRIRAVCTARSMYQKNRYWERARPGITVLLHAYGVY